MKKDIHPKDYRKVLFIDNSNDAEFVIASTVATAETAKAKDGKTYPMHRLEVSSASHPFYTGNGSGKNTGTLFEKVMKSPRDTVPFKNITDRLGMSWQTTPVSCPLGVKYNSSRGYGGGMGPSQFIPSTWELFKETLGSLLNISGNSVDPWNPQHAFMATAVYMRDLGASSGMYTAERNAACRYYSGATCAPGRKPSNIFYGDQVMAKADLIQRTMIDPLQGL